MERRKGISRARLVESRGRVLIHNRRRNGARNRHASASTAPCALPPLRSMERRKGISRARLVKSLGRVLIHNRRRDAEKREHAPASTAPCALPHAHRGRWNVERIGPVSSSPSGGRVDTKAVGATPATPPSSSSPPRPPRPAHFLLRAGPDTLP
ncbi:hypothetical protein M885DRAFT_505663 [Pelagophyceae sp. CCMP2097]|nr:hypothetical protein M885DRAFT_505663 [Pelagophyceae sp. CCMP2097]